MPRQERGRTKGTMDEMGPPAHPKVFVLLILFARTLTTSRTRRLPGCVCMYVHRYPAANASPPVSQGENAQTRRRSNRQSGPDFPPGSAQSQLHPAPACPRLYSNCTRPGPPYAPFFLEPVCTYPEHRCIVPMEKWSQPAPSAARIWRCVADVETRTHPSLALGLGAAPTNREGTLLRATPPARRYLTWHGYAHAKG